MAQQNRPDLKAKILANLPDNTTEAITPTKHREVEDNIADSNYNILTDDATIVSYSPTTGTDWSDPDPAEVGGALDDLASRVTTIEGEGLQTATETPYTLTAPLDWDGTPNELQSSTDELASRVRTIENEPNQTATETTYNPTTGTDWVDPDPTEVGGALDDLAGRVTTIEGQGFQTAVQTPYTPASVGGDWLPEGDPTEVKGGLDILAARTYRNPSLNIAYVSTNGDDATGEVGNPLRPYAIPFNAANALGSNGVIKLLGGNYSSFGGNPLFLNQSNITLDISGCTINQRIILDGNGITVIAHGANVNSSLSFGIGSSGGSTNIKIFGGTYTGTGVGGINNNLHGTLKGWRVYDAIFKTTLATGNVLRNTYCENCEFENTSTGTALETKAGEVTLFGGTVKGGNLGIQNDNTTLYLKGVEIEGENGINGTTIVNNVTNIIADSETKITGTVGYGVRLVNKADIVKFDSCTINGATDTIVYDGDGGLGVYRTAGTNNIFKNNVLYAGTGAIFNAVYNGSDAGVANMIGNTTNIAIVYGAKVIDNGGNTTIAGLQEI